MTLILFESRVDVEIHPKAEFLTGKTVPVEVVISPHEQLNAPELRLELVGIYYISRADGRIPVTASIAKEFTRVSYAIKDIASFYPEITSSSKVNVHIPEDAPPSCRGKIVNVDWDATGNTGRTRTLPEGTKVVCSGEEHYCQCRESHIGFFKGEKIQRLYPQS